MIVDTSALIAILRKEQGYQSFIETLLKKATTFPAPTSMLQSNSGRFPDEIEPESRPGRC
jgi:uncharacterized protein with PIN domain